MNPIDIETDHETRVTESVVRVITIFEVLHRLEEVDVSTIAETVARVMPSPVCARTVRRDLAALQTVGFVTRRRRMLNGRGRDTYAISTPRKIKAICDAYRAKGRAMFDGGGGDDQ